MFLLWQLICRCHVVDIIIEVGGHGLDAEGWEVGGDPGSLNEISINLQLQPFKSSPVILHNIILFWRFCSAQQIITDDVDRGSLGAQLYLTRNEIILPGPDQPPRWGEATANRPIISSWTSRAINHRWIHIITVIKLQFRRRDRPIDILKQWLSLDLRAGGGFVVDSFCLGPSSCATMI